MFAVSRCIFLLIPTLLVICLWGTRDIAAEPTNAVEPAALVKYAPTSEELLARYQRAQQPQGSRRVYKDLVTPHWFDGDAKMWYRNELRGGEKEFILVDAEQGTRGPAFDHARLAKSLSKATDREYRAGRLPFDSITLDNKLKSVRFTLGKESWICDLDSYECVRGGAKPEPVPMPVHVETISGEPMPWPEAPSFDPHGPREEIALAQPARQVRSPDRKRVAFIQNNNIVLGDADGNEVPLTKDGHEGLAYGYLNWSPDSQYLVALRTSPGEQKTVSFVESSPRAGGRALLHTRPYALPGDKFAVHELHVFDAAKREEIKVETDKIDFGTPRPRWKPDGQTFTYEQVDRGHQRFRLIEVNARTGKARSLIDEQSKTFIWTAHFDGINLPTVAYLKNGEELIHPSEKSGWRHLYLIDAKTGQEQNAITSGEYVVRGIDRIDEESRQIWFRASGKNAGQDPYFMHFYRVNFDGTGLVALTEGDGTHNVVYSPERKFLIDSYSRVDAAPVTELRRVSDGKLVCKLEEADTADLKASGFEAPEVFTAKGRDGTTDIWGIICRPRNFDPKKKYPVIEYIYAGPHGSFVPKAFSSASRFQSLTELGFIVVQCDGMGTANRSKAFHDVCWHNLKDSGFPDRILWHKAIAEKYPYYDLSRVGIYGTSAGGQSTLAALLHHGDFYKAGMAACGCHDNRMDKASWNEQWMGYPVGPHYAANSNVDNAGKLRGKLLLIVGEMDTNVPPESTFRVVDALVKANKDFDLIVVPGMGHSDGGSYGRRRMQDFFVKHLHGIEPPDRNAAPQVAPRKNALENVSLLQPEPLPIAPPPRLKLRPVDVVGMIRTPANEALTVTRRYEVDRAALLRTYVVPFSPVRLERLRKFESDWLATLKAVNFNSMSPASREELLTLRARVAENLQDLNRKAMDADAILPLLPFAETIIALEESRRRIEPVDAVEAAGRVDALRKQVESLSAILKSGKLPATEWSATRAADATDQLRASLKTWHSFYAGYDPTFTWWLAEPYRLADLALTEYAKSLREATRILPDPQRVPAPRLVVARYPGPSDAPDFALLMHTPGSEFTAVLDQYGRGRAEPSRWLAGLRDVKFDGLTRAAQVDYLLFQNHLEREVKRQELRASGASRPPVPRDSSGISGRPIGRDGILVELKGELIPYTPEELIALARKELDWCDAEMLKASRDMGCGNDWRTALEKVKTKHLQPGEQPRLIRALSDEAIAYLKQNDLVTIPPLAEETWRMIMMSPQRQLVSPFFTGGEVISVAFPTDTMAHDAKLQSLRGNNLHFSRATVQHELIPGHHLQQFMNSRHQPQRSRFSTPFWTEGWALYWELVLYSKGFPKTPEDRIGFLTWRKHRCARIIFSLSYHMGLMKPQECIDLLTDRVGFEPENAAAEVRRSFGGGYGPLYQAAYLLGGFQFWELRKELVDTGKMSEREFHDAILNEHAMPVAMVRAILMKQPLTADGLPPWRFGKM